MCFWFVGASVGASRCSGSRNLSTQGVWAAWEVSVRTAAGVFSVREFLLDSVMGDERIGETEYRVPGDERTRAFFPSGFRLHNPSWAASFCSNDKSLI